MNVRICKSVRATSGRSAYLSSGGFFRKWCYPRGRSAIMTLKYVNLTFGIVWKSDVFVYERLHRTISWTSHDSNRARDFLGKVILISSHQSKKQTRSPLYWSSWSRLYKTQIKIRSDISWCKVIIASTHAQYKLPTCSNYSFISGVN